MYNYINFYKTVSPKEGYCRKNKQASRGMKTDRKCPGKEKQVNGRIGCSNE